MLPPLPWFPAVFALVRTGLFVVGVTSAAVTAATRTIVIAAGGVCASTCWTAREAMAVWCAGGSVGKTEREVGF